MITSGGMPSLSGALPHVRESMASLSSSTVGLPSSSPVTGNLPTPSRAVSVTTVSLE